MAFTVENLHHLVGPREGLVVVRDLMVDDDVEVNLEAISSEYGGGLLKWKKDDKKDDDDKKDVEEEVKSEEEQPQVVKYEDSEPPTVVVYYNGKKDVQHANETMVVAEVVKTDIVFFNQEEVIGEAYQSVYLLASADQTTVVSVEEHTMEVAKNEDEANQASTDQTTAVSVEEQTIETKESKEEVERSKEEVVDGNDDDDGNLQKKPDPVQLVLIESEVDVTLKKRNALTDVEINERAFKMACRMNQLHAQLDELLPGVLLESFIQRPIFQNEKNQVNQVWSLRKDELSPKAMKDNTITYRRIGEETVCLNALYTLYPKQWLDNEVIDVYSKALIQYFDTQYHAFPDKEKIMLADVFVCQYIGRAFNVWTHNMFSPKGVELKKKSIWEQITSTQ
ncbi:hypothetical protein GIB67_036979 [Kingdonia uniflora]|uniref:Uncharacterized protein n=1 Tax=Kingdonia uniflora TaxID=39325 RepID=A0A7J7NVS7_9MAGN|nr:hypothetical protein GIB67_036979 [Kingdonia uniflora]